MRNFPLTLPDKWYGHIDNAIAEALKMSREYNRHVYFQFNDFRTTVHKRLSAKHVRGQFDESGRARSIRWKNSKAGKEYFAKRKASVAKKQARIDELVTNLGHTVNNMDDLLRWLAEFGPLADDIDVNKDLKYIYTTIENAGYGIQDCKNPVPNDKEGYGRHVIGACVGHMHSKLPPHPLVEFWAEKYFKM